MVGDCVAYHPGPIDVGAGPPSLNSCTAICLTAHRPVIESIENPRAASQALLAVCVAYTMQDATASPLASTELKRRRARHTRCVGAVKVPRNERCTIGIVPGG